MTAAADYPVLSNIDSPADLRRLPERALADVARELRRYLVESVSRSGGHFAAGLGAVELTIALHYLYDTPHDRIVWDVGHQSYPHKILTGRRDLMHSVRKWGGVSPFPKRSESPYDTFGVGHAGTSIGAAAGMAIAARRTGSDRKVVAVIGDGGLTCGMAFEALNHAGGAGADMLVVFNDNEMSISPNVGALTNRFAQLLSSRLYATVRESGRKVLSRVPPMQEFARRAEEHVKGLIVPGALFEEFGFNYVGPIDGHDLNALLPTLKNLRRLGGPQLLHVVTRKGKGYAPAESDPVKYHGIGSPFDPAVGIVPAAAPATPKPTYSQVFGDWLCDMAERDERLVAITPAMREGSKMERFEQLFPERYFDVAIAEQHSVTFAAGLACEGLKPVVAIYSTFLQRAYDQVVHDVVLQDLPVMLAIDRAGVVGGDGPTHAGAYDVTCLRCLPNIVIMTPADENETRRMLCTGFAARGPERGALSARRGPRRAGRGRDGGAPRRQGRGAAPGVANRVSLVRAAAAPRHGGGGRTGCDGVQHALRQAAGRGHGAVARPRARAAGDGRGECGGGSGRRGERVPVGQRRRWPTSAHRTPGPVHPARRPRRHAHRRGARRRRYRPVRRRVSRPSRSRPRPATSG